MSSRSTGERADKIYAAAQAWVDSALRSDGSLFTPGKKIWTAAGLATLRTQFLDRPDDSKDDFYKRLERQLAGSPPEVYQLMAEVLFVHYLIVGGIAGDAKRRPISRVIAWSPEQVAIPGTLDDSLTDGFINLGRSTPNLQFQIGTQIEIIEQWKQLSSEEHNLILSDAWAFKEFVLGRQLTSTLLANRPTGGQIEKEMLLHIVFPDEFEPISTGGKKQITDAAGFTHFIKEPTDDVDRKLQQIRHGITATRGDFNHFWEPGIKDVWDKRSTPTDPWDEYVAAAKACLEKETLEEDELNYKHEIARHLASARDRLRDGHDTWMEPLLNGLRNVQGFPVYFATLRDTHTWIEEQPDAARDALKTLWAEGDTPIPTRIRDFKDHLPDALVRKAGAASVTSLVSTLLMGLDVDQYPPYNYTRLNAAYKRTQYIQIDEEHDEAGRYAAELEFLDKFIAEAHKRGVDLQNRLVAQSVVWGIHTDDKLPENGVVTPPSLSAKLYLPEPFLQEIDSLLRDKGQVIFQGPPGTGKTFVAQELAEHLTGSSERVNLVQFHPSYSYEDFVQGYRPTLKDGQPGFALRDGPLLTAADTARQDSDNTHVLIIDEINRGNIASIFGELYFLLEYRDKEINLQYSDTRFSLPRNLYIIGTMNTADRSIALVDLALRRRFYFVEFHPDNEPVGGVLRRFLQAKKPEMEWVANVVDHANELLRDDRHAAIGPSYFMNLNLDDDMVERIWIHSVLPYIEERKFGGERVAEEFSLGTLRDTARGTDDTDRAEGNAANDDAGGVSHATLGTSTDDAT